MGDQDNLGYYDYMKTILYSSYLFWPTTMINTYN